MVDLLNCILVVDRVVMFLTNNYSIKEVLTFPFMKDENVAPKPKAVEVANVEPQPEEGIRKSPRSFFGFPHQC